MHFLSAAALASVLAIVHALVIAKEGQPSLLPSMARCSWRGTGGAAVPGETQGRSHAMTLS